MVIIDISCHIGHASTTYWYSSLSLADIEIQPGPAFPSNQAYAPAKSMKGLCYLHLSGLQKRLAYVQKQITLPGNFQDHTTQNQFSGNPPGF